MPDYNCIMIAGYITQVHLVMFYDLGVLSFSQFYAIFGPGYSFLTKHLLLRSYALAFVAWRQLLAIISLSVSTLNW